MKKIALVFLVAAAFLFTGATVGQQMPNVKLLTLKKNKWVKSWIPYMGKKVLTVMYTDVDTADMNDPLSDAIKARKYSKSKYIGIGIANSKDAPWKPDFFIRMAVKGKMKKYKGAVVLVDEDRSFSKRLGLGNCNQKAVILVIGKDRKIKYIKKISSSAQSKAMIPAVLKIMDGLLK